MVEVDSKKKLEWQCRRGMLELDVILLPFLEKYYNGLSAKEQVQFSELLAQEDPDIYTWIMGFGRCEQQNLVGIIETIRDEMSIV